MNKDIDMRLANLLNAKNYKRYRMRVFKELLSIPHSKGTSIPIFVFGLQRSGTTMMMNIFEMDHRIKVYKESKENKVFTNSLIKSYNILHHTIDVCKMPYVAYKTLCDSHKIIDILHEFEPCKALWIYRNYRDVANSYDRKWPHADRAIRIVCTGGTGGGWFQEGVSEDSQHILRDIYSSHLTRYDCLCLAWWARNRLVIEHNLGDLPNVLLVDYDRLVQHKFDECNTIYQFLGLDFRERMVADVHAESIGRHQVPAINPDVQQLCDDLTGTLEQSFLSNRAFHALEAAKA
jgi:hypothetical protein